MMKIGLGRFLTNGLIFGIVAAVLNLIVFFIGQSLNGGPLDVVRPGSTDLTSVPILMVIIMSIVPCLLAGLLYYLLQGTGRASLIFTIIALIVFMAFFFSAQTSAQGATANWVLQIMHLLVAIPAVEGIVRSIRFNTAGNI